MSKGSFKDQNWPVACRSPKRAKLSNGQAKPSGQRSEPELEGDRDRHVRHRQNGHGSSVADSRHRHSDSNRETDRRTDRDRLADRDRFEGRLRDEHRDSRLSSRHGQSDEPHSRRDSEKSRADSRRRKDRSRERDTCRRTEGHRHRDASPARRSVSIERPTAGVKVYRDAASAQGRDLSFGLNAATNAVEEDRYRRCASTAMSSIPARVTSGPPERLTGIAFFQICASSCLDWIQGARKSPFEDDAPCLAVHSQSPHAGIARSGYWFAFCRDAKRKETQRRLEEARSRHEAEEKEKAAQRYKRKEHK